MASLGKTFILVGRKRSLLKFPEPIQPDHPATPVTFRFESWVLPGDDGAAR